MDQLFSDRPENAEDWRLKPVAAWREHAQRTSAPTPGTLRSRAAMVSKFAEFLRQRDRSLLDCGADDVAAFLASLSGKRRGVAAGSAGEVSDWTRLMYSFLLRPLFLHLEHTGLRKASPLSDIGMNGQFRAERGLPMVLDAGHVRHYIEFASQYASPRLKGRADRIAADWRTARDRVLCLMPLATGAKLDELRQLRGADLQCNSTHEPVAVMLSNSRDPKTRRTVALPEYLRAALSHLLALQPKGPSDWIFLGDEAAEKSGPVQLSAHYASARIGKMMADAQVGEQRLGAERLRNRWAVQMIEQLALRDSAVDLRELQTLLGAKTPYSALRLMEVYRRESGNDAIEVVDTSEGALPWLDEAQAGENAEREAELDLGDGQ
jgi:site-specific recombinase XerD